MVLASGVVLSQTLITMSSDQLHSYIASPGTRGAVCFGTTFIDHRSDQDQDQSDDDCDVIRNIVMARDTSDTIIMSSAILTPLILTFLTPGNLGSPVPLATVLGQDEERHFQEKLL